MSRDLRVNKFNICNFEMTDCALNFTLRGTKILPILSQYSCIDLQKADR